ncbi:type I CRISPR-associated protein Cas7 [Clostridium tetani]|uniref:type I CRISPR-associated protein Cas7 n=1 Tax=Clostridium tetani TaxID=1513 RepID=UPI00100A8967|nr:type I CRISPR-associated protein Cas7 [Clostridium tetani]RXI44987.1 CRISPR-associated protein [Clostridium tetani]RXM60279.1 CRISPR-associated protein [Clostridium tetani]
MNKRVYGVLGIVSRMSNWNADFTGYPKTTSSGDVFGSDKAFKYPMKKMWENGGEKVLYIKSIKFQENKKKERELIPRTLKERYEYIFDVEDLKKNKDSEEVLKNLFTAIDVKNFGATFAEEGNNISITGAVQIGQGFNKYKETYAEEQQILSPFRDPNQKEKSKDGEEAKSSTLGTKIVSNEAHYFYPFVVNPSSYNQFEEIGVTNGYTEEDYKKFKEASMIAATYFNTNSKIGCENEFALFVETKEDLYLPDLSQYVDFEKVEDKNIITLSCSELLNSFEDEIENIEIYYNPYTTEIKLDEIKKAKKFNIFTKKEV